MRRLLQRALCVAAALWVAAAAGCGPKRAEHGPWEKELEDLQVQLNEALEAKDFAPAETLALQAVATVPGDPKVRDEMLPELIEPLAFALLRQGKFDAAEARYRELFALWDASGLSEENQYQRLPAFFEFAGLLGKLDKPGEQEALLKRAALIAHNLVRRVSGYYLQQPIQQVGGQAFARYLSSALLELARLYMTEKRYGEANLLALRAVWSVERLYGMDPGAVGEVRAYYDEFAAQFPDSIQRPVFKAGVPSFGGDAPAVDWLDVPPVLDESDLLLWDKLWYEGQIAEASGKFEEALPLYSRTREIGHAYLAAGGKEHDALLLSMGALARVLSRLGRYDEAAKVHVDAVEVRRTLGEEQLIAGLIEAGAFYLSVKKTLEAAAVLEEALPLVQAKFGNTNTNYALVRTLLASAALQRGDAAGAAELYDRYLLGLEVILGASNELLVMLFNDYAAALQKLGREEQFKQLGAYLRSMESPHNFEPARIALMACRARLQKDRDVESATGCFDKALAVSPVFPSGYRLAGSSLLWFADANKEAIGYFEKALSQFAVYPVVYNEMAYAYIGMENFDAAMGVAGMQIQLAPGDANAYDTLGDVYKSKGELEKAIESYRTACALGMQASCERRELQQ